MKLISLVLFACLLLSAQVQPGQRSFASPQQRQQMLAHPPSENVGAQAAGSVMVQLTADQVTILEKMRVDAIACSADPTTHAVTCPARFASVQEVLQSVVNGFVLGLSKTYPPPSVKAAQDAAKTAQEQADDANAKALPPPKQ